MVYYVILCVSIGVRIRILENGMFQFRKAALMLIMSVCSLCMNVMLLEIIPVL